MYRITLLYSNHRYFTVFNSSVLDGKIINGDDVSAGESVNFIASIQLALKRICGAFVVSPETALTAGQCLKSILPFKKGYPNVTLFFNDKLYQIKDVRYHQEFYISYAGDKNFKEIGLVWV